MANFDLSKEADFAKLVTGAGAGLLQNFTAHGESGWQIDEASYRLRGEADAAAVVFHVFKSPKDYGGALAQIADQGGRRKIKFKFPYKDGQTTGDLGRTPGTFQLDILLFGNNYLSAVRALFVKLNDPKPGILHHPVTGDVDCVMEAFEMLHSNEKRKAAAIRLTMIEHNFSAADIIPKKDPTVRGALSKLQSAFTFIDSAINKVEATFLAVRSLKNQIKGYLQAYKDLYAKNAGNMNKTFNPGGTQDFPGLLPVTEGGSQNSSGQIVNDITSSVVSPSDPFAKVPLSSLSAATAQAVAIEQLAKDIQGSRDQLTIAINAMSALSDEAGSLEFYDEILGLQQTAIDAQDAFEKGKASSQSRIINYTVPRLMSIREVAFANGITVDRVNEIELLNPEMESTNFLPKDTVLRVVVA